MNTPVRLSAADRNRSLARLRSLTIGTTVLSVAAVGGFGSLAAFTNPGKQAQASTSSGTSSVGGGFASASAGDSSTSTTTTTRSHSRSTTGGALSSLQAAWNSLTASSGTAQVSSGGS